MLFAFNVVVILLLASRRTSSQPTHDIASLEDAYHWKESRDLLEELTEYHHRFLEHNEHQQRHQRAQEERFERLEQMLSESLAGQRRMESQVSQLQQQTGDQLTRYASLQQHQTEVIRSLQSNITDKLEAVSEQLRAVDAHQIEQEKTYDTLSNITVILEAVGGRAVGAIVEKVDEAERAIIWQSERNNEMISRTFKAEFRNLSAELADAQHDLIASYQQIIERSANGAESVSHALTSVLRNMSTRLVDAQQQLVASVQRQCQNSSAEQLKAVTASIMPIQQEQNRMVDIIEGSLLVKVHDFTVNMSQKFTEVDERFSTMQETLSASSQLSRETLAPLIRVSNASLGELRAVASLIGANHLQQQADAERLMNEVTEATNVTGHVRVVLLETYEHLQRQIKENTSQVLSEVNALSQSQNRQQSLIERVEERVNASSLMIGQGQDRLRGFIAAGLREQRQMLADGGRLMANVTETCAGISEQSRQQYSSARQHLTTQLATLQSHLESLANANRRVRLVGGTSREGRLELSTDCGTVWGTVCDDHFGSNDARVACNMLGFGFHGRAIANRYGAGGGRIHLDDLSCTGRELSLFDCPHRGVGVHDCSHSEDISISCC